jgi:hypothetical protein
MISDHGITEDAIQSTGPPGPVPGGPEGPGGAEGNASAHGARVPGVFADAPSGPGGPAGSAGPWASGATLERPPSARAGPQSHVVTRRVPLERQSSQGLPDEATPDPTGIPSGGLQPAGGSFEDAIR